jgi:hypothetical protein
MTGGCPRGKSLPKTASQLDAQRFPPQGGAFRGFFSPSWLTGGVGSRAGLSDPPSEKSDD